MTALDRRITPARPGSRRRASRRAGGGRAIRRGHAHARAGGVRRRPTPSRARRPARHGGAARRSRHRLRKDDEGWAWGQLASDSYVGWMPASALIAGVPAPTHRVTVLRTFVYPGPSMKLPPLTALSLGSTVQVASHRAAISPSPRRAPSSPRHLAPVAASRGGFRRRRGALHRRALSVGRQDQPRPRLFRPRPALALLRRHRRPARQRHAVRVARRDAARRLRCCGAAISCSGRAMSA